MNSRFLVILLGVVLLAVCVLQAQVVFTPFTAEQTSPGARFTKFGSYICPGGEPAGPFPPNPPCTPGSRVQVRDAEFYNLADATDPRMTGKYVIGFNANTEGWTPAGPGSGPIWGTIRVEVWGGSTREAPSPTGEVWEGTYTGKREVGPAAYVTLIQAEAHGSGGGIEGLKVKFEIKSEHTGHTTIAGWILEPPGK